ISMCGIVPAVFVLETLRQMGRLNECEFVGYTTSGEVSGRLDRVVGYAGALFR
ncbi:MAG: AmmeMemoRadiSam system protein B, partial [Clostridia bacterium]|nr:AmmeMemoRadiSam system protein B [Clostridia bacterium]